MCPLVSVCVISYNQEKFIRQTLDGISDQKVSFPVEVLIADDCSSDHTRSVIAEWYEENRDKARLCYRAGNVGPNRNFSNVLKEAKGKYIAICEGDDYWTDPDKLQKQIDFMESNPGFSMCFHDVTIRNEINGTYQKFSEGYRKQLQSGNTVFSVLDILNQNFIPTLSVLYRRYDYDFPDWFYAFPFCDWILHVMNAREGKIKFIPETMGVYRIHSSGIWSSKPINFREAAITQFYMKMHSFLGSGFSDEIVNILADQKMEYVRYSSSLIEANEFNIKQIQNRDDIISDLKDTLDTIYSSYGWKLAQDIFSITSMFFPEGTLRFKIIVYAYSVLSFFLRKFRNLFRKIKRIPRRTKSFVKKLLFPPKKLRRVNEKWDESVPFLSVIIPCFNYGRYVEEAIDSVLSQTFDNIEIIVVDGCSDDADTKEILSKMNKPKTRVVFRENRCLVGDNRNFGISLARGKYICCLDADDTLGDTYFEKALFFLEKYGYDVVYPGAQCFGESDLEWHAVPTSYERMLEQNYVPTVAVFAKHAWEASGGYKDWPIGENHVPEDWDFWTRLAGMGYRFKAIPELLMYYRVHGSGLTAKNGNQFENQRKAIIAENSKYSTSDYKKKRKPVEMIVRNPYCNLMTRKERKRILLALPYTIIGGADSIMLKIFGHLRGEYDITVITTVSAPAEFGDNSPEYRKITSELYHLPLFAGSNREAEEFIRYLFVTRSFDVVFMVGCELIYLLLPEIKKSFPGVRVVDQLFNEFGHMRNNRKYSKYIDFNIVANDLISEILKTKYRQSADRIRVITHSVDTGKEYNPANIAKSDLTSVFDDIDGGTLIISFFGRLSIEKAPDLFIEIVRCLKDRNIRFIMTGNGPEFGNVRNLIAEYGLERTVYLPGFVDDIKPFIRATDVVIIPSRIEGLPIILLEAMSFGVPVISSDVGGIPKVIENGINGFLCEKENVGSFVAAVEKLYENRFLLDEMKAKTREYAVREFDEKRMLDEYSGVIQSVLRG